MSPNASHNIDDSETLLVSLQNNLGIVVPDDQRNNVLERIAPVLSMFKLDSLSSLAKSLENGESEEIKAVVLGIVSKTQLSWRLNGEIKHVLNDYIFSQLSDYARIWVVGCGQGQSAYAVAMEAAEYEHNHDGLKNIEFCATDISATEINQAKLGIYNKQQVSGLSEEYKKLFTTLGKKAGEIQVKEKIRQKVKFSECDLTVDFQVLGKMDLIICPEALAYFSNDIKASILQQCSNLLKSGGILLTGSSQIFMPIEANLERVDHSAGVFYRRKD